jgi:hypothetical protein
MFTGLGGLDGPFGVLGMRRGDVDRLDARIGQKRLIRAVAAGNAELVAEGVGLGLGPRPDGYKFTSL